MRNVTCCAAIGVLAFVSADAFAAPPEKKPRGTRDDTVQFQLNRDNTPATYAAKNARARARSGDYAGALDAFDQAVRLGIDPTVRRDRGLCHEQLNHPFPAIDDYRAYLTAMPEAADADQIRERLERLEQSTAPAKNPEPPSSKSGAKTQGASGSVSLSLNGEGTSASSSSSSSASSGSGANATVDTERASVTDNASRDELTDDQVETSALRYGTGFILGPYLWVRNVDFNSNGWGETLGIALRYSLTRSGTLIGEVGYANNNGAGSATTSGGPALFLGYELRVDLGQRLTNGLILGAGLGFERVTQTASRLAIDGIMPRGRIGYRRVIGAGFGLEAMFDAGAYIIHVEDVPQQPDKKAFGMAGGSVALVVAF